MFPYRRRAARRSHWLSCCDYVNATASHLIPIRRPALCTESCAFSTNGVYCGHAALFVAAVVREALSRATPLAAIRVKRGGPLWTSPDACSPLRCRAPRQRAHAEASVGRVATTQRAVLSGRAWASTSKCLPGPMSTTATRLGKTGHPPWRMPPHAADAVSARGTRRSVIGMSDSPTAVPRDMFTALMMFPV